MKRLSALLLVSGILLFAVSCNFSKGTYTNSTIGLTYSYNGLKVGNVTLHESSKNNPLKGKEIKIGKVLYINIDNISGFTEEDGKIYPGCQIIVTDEDGNVALKEDDLYKGGYDPKQASAFWLNVTMGSPIVAGKQYKTEAHIYDKKNEKNKLDITVESDVIQ